MDLSKLPRLSETDKHAPPPPPESATADQPSPARVPSDAERNYPRDPMVPSGAPEAWISLAIGVIVLAMNPRFLQWASSRLFGMHFNEFVMPDGTIVPYPKVPEFWSDLGPTLFAFVLIFEGLVIALAPRKPLVWAAFLLTVAATAFNLGYVVLTYSTRGLAIFSALAVAYGVYIAMSQWRMIKLLRWSRA